LQVFRHFGYVVHKKRNLSHQTRAKILKISDGDY